SALSYATKISGICWHGSDWSATSKSLGPNLPAQPADFANAVSFIDFISLSRLLQSIVPAPPTGCNEERESGELFSQVCSRAALARVRSGAKIGTRAKAARLHT